MAAVAVLIPLLAACATPVGPAGPAAQPDPASPASASPAPPETEVVGQGTVLEDADGTRLCLGGVMESYPPQCSGVPLTGWSWDGVPGSETAEGVTWGAYAVQGTYDGEAIAVTQEPVLLALYDPMMAPDPTGGEPGGSSEDELLDVQEDIHTSMGDAILASAAQNGWLWVDVVWDDGSIQQAVDAAYGEGVVVVRSALRALEG